MHFRCFISLCYHLIFFLLVCFPFFASMNLTSRFLSMCFSRLVLFVSLFPSSLRFFSMLFFFIVILLYPKDHFAPTFFCNPLQVLAFLLSFPFLLHHTHSNLYFISYKKCFHPRKESCEKISFVSHLSPQCWKGYDIKGFTTLKKRDR